jgi:hypothetical protein
MVNNELYTQLLNESFLKLEVSLKSFELSYNKCKDIGLKANYSFGEAEAFDSLTSKFARISDIFTQKILRSIFLLLHEGTPSLIDLANSAEKLNIIKDADTLLLIRDIRNQISHEYDEENLNLIYNQIFELAYLLKEDIFKSKQFAYKYQWLIL